MTSSSRFLAVVNPALPGAAEDARRALALHG